MIKWLSVVLLGTLAFKGCRRRYCFKAIVLSCQSKIQDGGLARRAPKRTRNLVTYEYVKVNTADAPQSIESSALRNTFYSESEFKGELIYVDKGHHSHLWDRNSVSAQNACAVPNLG